MGDKVGTVSSAQEKKSILYKQWGILKVPFQWMIHSDSLHHPLEIKDLSLSRIL